MPWDSHIAKVNAYNVGEAGGFCQTHRAKGILNQIEIKWNKELVCTHVYIYNA